LPLECLLRVVGRKLVGSARLIDYEWERGTPYTDVVHFAKLDVTVSISVRRRMLVVRWR
jgi:hypothetical protein